MDYLPLLSSASLYSEKLKDVLTHVLSEMSCTIFLRVLCSISLKTDHVKCRISDSINKHVLYLINSSFFFLKVQCFSGGTLYVYRQVFPDPENKLYILRVTKMITIYWHKTNWHKFLTHSDWNIYYKKHKLLKHINELLKSIKSL